MIDLWTYLENTTKPIFLYGTGDGADKILDRLEKRNIKVSGVFASDGFVRNREFRGFQVISFNEAIESHGEIIALLCFGTQLSEVIGNIKEIANKCELYAPDVPVIDDGTTFDIEYARENKGKIEAAYNLLADDVSRKTFENIVFFKLTGDINYLFDCEKEKSEAYTLLSLGEKEDYLDLGAYTADTIFEFLGQTNGYNTITAVEPDIKNFKKLSSNTQSLDRITLINAAVGKQSGEVFFSMGKGRGSKSTEKGQIIKQICIDDLLENKKATYIKIDIEGLEQEALLGAEKSLLERPKLNLALYHRNQDVFELVLLINKLNPDYKIYLRHHPYLPAWDTNLYAL